MEEFLLSVLNVHRGGDVRLMEICTAEPFIPDHNPFEVEVSIAKL
jgi:hypothetical protein